MTEKAQSGLILLNKALTANPFPSAYQEVKLISHLCARASNCINFPDYISDDCNIQFL